MNPLLKPLLGVPFKTNPVYRGRKLGKFTHQPFSNVSLKLTPFIGDGNMFIMIK